jgi:hypothetical protein
LQIIQEKLDLRLQDNIEESPEMLAAIDEGLRSLQEEGSIPIEEVERRMKTWTFKST